MRLHILFGLALSLISASTQMSWAVDTENSTDIPPNVRGHLNLFDGVGFTDVSPGTASNLLTGYGLSGGVSFLGQGANNQTHFRGSFGYVVGPGSPSQNIIGGASICMVRPMISQRSGVSPYLHLGFEAAPQTMNF